MKRKNIRRKVIIRVNFTFSGISELTSFRHAQTAGIFPLKTLATPGLFRGK